MKKILVTGANGFVGNATYIALSNADFMVMRAIRYKTERVRESGWDDSGLIALPDLESSFDITKLLQGFDTVIHLAARVHVMGEPAAVAAERHQAVNAEGTRRLAEQASHAGVRRFVYLSSVKVLGESAPSDRPFTDTTPAAPVDPYGQSKLAAEDNLFRVADRSGMEAVVLRPPLIYGRGVRANFNALIRLCNSPWPLPFGAVAHNRRSMVHVENLADALRFACTDDGLVGRRALVADDTCLSTADLCRHIRQALGRSPRLVPVPPAMLNRAAAILGKRAAAERLLGSLVVDPVLLRRDRGWSPPVGLDEAMARTVQTGLQSPMQTVRTGAG